MAKRRKTKTEIHDVVLYKRVSTTDQAERDLSLPAQDQNLRGPCGERGWSIVGDYVEPGASATDDNRPVFQKMMRELLARQVEADAIVVYQTSRFMRNATKARIWKEKLAKEGIRVIAIAQEVADDAMGNVIEGLFELIDEYESKVNGLRTRAALEENARQGYFNGSRPPFGFRRRLIATVSGRSKAKLEPDPEEADALKEVFTLYLATSGAKTTARELNQKGLRYRKEKFWTKDLVLKVVEQTAAMGTYHWGKRDSATGALRDESEWIPIEVEAIISKELFDAAQRVRKQRDPKRNPGRTASSSLLLSGLVRCGACGACYQLEMSGKQSKSGEYVYRYYNCKSACRAGKEKCSGYRIRTEVLDEAVLGHMADKLFTAERCRLILTELDENHGLLTEKTEEERRQLKRQAHDVDTRLANLREAAETGRLPADVGADWIGELTRKRADLTRTLKKIRPLRPRPDLYSDASIARFQASVRSIFMEGNALARNYLRFLVEEIVISGDDIEITAKKEAVAQLLAAGGETQDALGKEGIPVSPTSVVGKLRKRDLNSRPSG